MAGAMRSLGVMGKIRDKVVGNPEEKATAEFRSQMARLLELDKFTLDDYGAILAEGLGSWRAKVPFLKSISGADAIKRSAAFVAAFTPAERARPASIKADAKARVAAAAGGSIAEVDQMLRAYTQMDALQRWLKARKARGQRLPRDPHDVQELSRDSRGLTIAPFVKQPEAAAAAMAARAGKKRQPPRKAAREPIIF